MTEIPSPSEMAWLRRRGFMGGFGPNGRACVDASSRFRPSSVTHAHEFSRYGQIGEEDG
jgi:hypothetical protein